MGYWWLKPGHISRGFSAGPREWASAWKGSLLSRYVERNTAKTGYKKEKQIHKYREKTSGCQRRRGSGKMVKGIQRYNLPAIKEISHGDEKYSRRNIVSNTIMCYHGEHSSIIVECWCCSPETNLILYVNYSSVKNKNKLNGDCICLEALLKVAFSIMPFVWQLLRMKSTEPHSSSLYRSGTNGP